MAGSIEVIREDITQLEVDAIVNAANQQLKGGGGVDGAIHGAGGPEILKECQEWVQENGKLPTGEAIITTAGDMPANHVIHTVGPVWNGGDHNEEKLLADAYRNSLQLASEYDLASIAFPNISTGVYGFPKDRAAKIAVKTVEQELKNRPVIESVYFVCFDEENAGIYEELVG